MDEQTQYNQTPQNVPSPGAMPQPGPSVPMSQNLQQPPVLDEQPEQPVQDEPQQWQYQSGNLTQSNAIDQPASQPNDVAPALSGDSINWNASEFMHHEKSSIWYIYVVLAALALAAAIYFITKEIFSAVVIVLIAIVFAIFGALKPKVLEYAIGPDGIQVGQKHFSFEEFRSFAVIAEGALPSIQLLPHKRFAVAITMYFEPKDADKIIEILGKYLPFEHQKRDLTDKLASKIHF